LNTSLAGTANANLSPFFAFSSPWSEDTNELRGQQRVPATLTANPTRSNAKTNDSSSFSLENNKLIINWSSLFGFGPVLIHQMMTNQSSSFRLYGVRQTSPYRRGIFRP
jgi:hypothetical protein